jgi:hypothetical protein
LQSADVRLAADGTVTRERLQLGSDTWSFAEHRRTFWRE